MHKCLVTQCAHQDWETTLQANEETLIAQNEMMEELITDKKKMALENASLTKKCAP
jgi:hypothetical protein